MRVTPGIRLSSQSKDDQAHIATPLMAKQEQSTQLVVGRPITKSDHPVAVYQAICKEFLGEGDV